MILVVGSTGLLGFKTCSILSEKEKKFRAMVRKSSDEKKVEHLKKMAEGIVYGDLKDPSSLQEACHGITSVISTASSTFSRQEGDSIQTVDEKGQLDLVQAAKDAGVQKFVFISFNETAFENPLNQAKRRVEKALQESGMNWTSLQAGFFMEIWLSPALGLDYSSGKARIYGDGEAKCSWISYNNVAEFAVHALYNELADNTTLGIGGPEALSQKEVVEIFEKVTGKQFQLENIPVEAIKQQYEQSTDPLQKSMAALTLQLTQGDPIDMKDILKNIHVDLTSVKDYAEGVTGK